MPRSRKLRVSGPALRDLERIGDNTLAEWGAAQRRNYLGHLKDGFKALRDTPGIGARRDDIHEGLRAHPVGKHIVFYRETKAVLTVVRVLHQSMNPDPHL